MSAHPLAGTAERGTAPEPSVPVNSNSNFREIFPVHYSKFKLFCAPVRNLSASKVGLGYD